MNKREKFLKEIAEVINRNSLEAHFNDTPDYILAKVAVEAMENFAEASARRDIGTDSKKPISRARLCGMRIATIARFGEFARNVGRTNTGSPRSIRSRRRSNVPKEVQAMAEFFGKMFPGSKVEIHRVEMPKRNPRDKRRAKNKRKGGRRNETR